MQDLHIFLPYPHFIKKIKNKNKKNKERTKVENLYVFWGYEESYQRPQFKDFRAMKKKWNVTRFMRGWSSATVCLKKWLAF